jgi:hypothetical protein
LTVTPIPDGDLAVNNTCLIARREAVRTGG